MQLDFERLSADPLWLRRYLLVWHLLLTFGTVAFLVLQGTYALFAQGLFFAAVFPLILWPLFAAAQPPRHR
jgi:hypothetical protein